MRIHFLLLCLLMTLTFAQDKMLTLEQAIQAHRLLPRRQTIKQLHWIPDQNAYAYIDSTNDAPALFRCAVEDSQAFVLLPLDSLAKALKPFDKGPLKSFPTITWLDSNQFRFKKKQILFVYNLKQHSIQPVNTIPDRAANVNLHAKTDDIAFSRGGNLFISFSGGKEKQITFKRKAGIQYGTNPYRHEFGVYQGSYWSESGKFLAFYKRDIGNVSEYPLVDFNHRPARMQAIKYPMAGMHSELTGVGVYNLNTGSKVWLQTGEPADQYLTNITWGPDDKTIYIVHLNRDQNHLRLVAYDPHTGKAVRTLFEEKDAEYIEPEHGPIFLNHNPSRFLWFSQRSGFNHLYLYRSDGKLLKQITKGTWNIIRFCGMDKKAETAFATATIKHPLDRHPLAIDLKSGKVHILDNRSGTHYIRVNSFGTHVIDYFENQHIPREIALLNRNGKSIRTLLTSANPYKNIALAKIEIKEHRSSDGSLLFSRTLYPPDFSVQQNYPVLIYVYGGPGSQLVRNTWLAASRLWYHYLAQNGYIIFTLDNRGTGNRGLCFEQATFRRLGTVELQDQLMGVEYLKSLPFVDSTRIGVHGWSYGGFMTTTMKTRAPGIFKTAIAGAPVIDWRYYEVMYTERYMDTPEANPKGYKTANLLNYVKDLEEHLFIVHGTLDSTVVPQHSILFIDKAIELNKNVDYLIYPGHDHGVGGKARLDLYKRITDYIFKYL